MFRIKGEMLNVWGELAGGRTRAFRRKYSDEELRLVFDSIDSDGNGLLDEDELKAALRQVNPTVDGPGADIDGMLDLADTDGDVQISFDEFKEILHRSSGGEERRQELKGMYERSGEEQETGELGAGSGSPSWKQSVRSVLADKSLAHAAQAAQAKEAGTRRE